MREFNKAVHWDSAAERYEKTAHPYTARYVDAALAHVPLKSASRVLDVAAGTGALTLAAAASGAKVLATDFSPGMVARIAARALPNVEARVMDGQALELPDAGFDAVFSIFGVFMFPDWRTGLAEMARVTRSGGYGVVAVWEDRGAGAFMLLGQLIRRLFPERELAAMPEAMTILSTAEGLAAELVRAGYREPQVEHVTRDFDLDMSALDDLDGLFGPSPDWTSLDDTQKGRIATELRSLAGDRPCLPIPSTALIGVARR
ncbi:class I SAM-dependent methyltransferase [Sphingomonas sp. CCH5-D11]|uniref:class I SAM-dependent methyltransferase n=1 Tax=Sphingomonas sp. CCH5-D11 TaxID=1768786 RepID=UPI00082B5E9D|nr:class I SAM-dependent methyltransferase [Sphingomonas sp. CCH5-D11]